MTDHFAYLYNDDEQDFFQKIACDIADEGIPSASEPMVKQASNAEPEVYSFEKVASRLDNDLFILKTAGECGIGVGMSKRASVYVDHILDECPMAPEEFEAWFDKVASTAIETDLSAAREELYKLAGSDVHLRGAVDDEIAFVGFHMAKLAQMEKEAIGAALRALFAAGKAGSKALLRRGGRGLLRGGSAVARGIGRGGRAIGRGTMAAGRGIKAAPGAALRGIGRSGRAVAAKYRQARLGLAERRLRGINRSLKGGLARKGTEGSKAYRRSLQESRGKELANVNKMMKNPKYQEAAAARRAQPGA